ncbi:MAG: hypothetical protein KDA57_13970 [Planctomycetales bacterium]|nr:hypothetical protein [Planctomycetales bacterium]
MAKFFVGQRVRIKDLSEIPYDLRGKEGVIVELYETRDHTICALGDLELVGSGNVVVCTDFDNETHTGHTDFLDPIQDDDQKAAEWEDCCFTPEGKYRELEPA